MKTLAFSVFTLIKVAMMGIAMIPLIAIVWFTGSWLISFELSFQTFLAAMMIPGIIALAIGGSCYYLLMRTVARAIRSK